MKAGRIEWLDLVRGIAAIVVVLVHLHVYLGIGWSQTLAGDLGAIAVDLFFALSGIVLALKYTAAIERGSSFLEFAGARWRRLYPMVFLAASFVAVLDVLGIPEAFDASAQFGWLLYLVLPLPGLWPQDFSFPADLPMWSLWAELVTNVLWFAVLRAGRRWMARVTVVFVAAHVLIAWKHGTLWDGFQQGVPMLAIGLIRALAWFNLGFYIAHLARKPVLATAPALAAFVACLGAIAWLSDTRWTVPVQLLAMATGLLLLHALLHAEAPPPRMGAIARWMGLLSYPLYLVHLPASRLLHDADGLLGHWGAFIVVVGGLATLATFANEAIVDRLQRWHRARRARLAAMGAAG